MKNRFSLHAVTFLNHKMLSMIQKLILWSRITEINDVATRLSGAFGNSGLTDPYLVACFTGLGEQSLELSNAIKRPKAESDLKEKDAVRDRATHALYTLLNGYFCHPSETVQEAAQTLLKVFDKYGVTVVRKNYSSESSLLGALLLDLARPEYAGAIATLSGCAELIARLQAAQNDFEQARLAYETEKAKEGMLKNATYIKKGVVETVNHKIVEYLRAMEQANPATFSGFAGTVAVIIAENNEVVKKRKQKRDVEATD